MTLFEVRRHRTMFGRLSVAGVVASAALAAVIGLSAGQAAQQNGVSGKEACGGNPDALVLIYPTGDRATSSLLVEAVAPAEVPVGKSYNYLIRVTNLTRNLILQDVEIHQVAPEGFSIEDSQLLGRGNTGQGQGGNATPQPDRNSDQDQGKAEKSAESRDQGKAQGQEKDKGQNSAQDQGKAQDQKKGEGQKQAENPGQDHASAHQGESARQKGQGGSEGQGGPQWKIERLGPGESRTIRVTAVGDREGMAESCIQVTYQPTLCVRTSFVKPEVQLTKTAHDRIDICEPMPVRYLLQNTGTGVARGLTIRDELPDGLTTAEGKRVVEINVGDLAAGQTVRRDISAHASRPGEYTSRAVAQGAGELSARSRQTTTKVVQAKLAATIEGPSVQYVGRPITYQVIVKNEGDAPAVDAKLEVDVDRNARVLRLSKAQPGDVDPAQATAPSLIWNLARIEPGQERTVSFTVVGNTRADFKHTARATSACAAGGDVARLATATESTTTSVLTFPALVLEMVDQNDPVPVGKDEVYTIAVRNQGSGPDENVKIVVQLPEQLTYVSSDGPTKASADERKVTFEPVKRLAPGERAVWKLRVKAEKAGDVRTRAELSSNYLSADRPGVSVEPTRLIE